MDDWDSGQSRCNCVDQRKLSSIDFSRSLCCCRLFQMRINSIRHASALHLHPSPLLAHVSVVDVQSSAAALRSVSSSNPPLQHSASLARLLQPHSLRNQRRFSMEIHCNRLLQSRTITRAAISIRCLANRINYNSMKYNSADWAMNSTACIVSHRSTISLSNMLLCSSVLRA